MKMKAWHAVGAIIIVVIGLYVYHMMTSHSGESLNPVK